MSVPGFKSSPLLEQLQNGISAMTQEEKSAIVKKVILNREMVDQWNF